MRLAPNERRRRLMRLALDLADERGLANLDRVVLAERAECSAALVSHYFGNSRGLRNATMREAVQRGVLSVIADGLGMRHPVARAAPTELKRAALESVE